MKKYPRTLILLLTIALIAASIFGYRQFNPTTSAQSYQSEKVTTGEIKQIVSANGTINPVSLVSIGTQVSGTVKKLYVDYNSKVEKGQLLVTLDDALLSAQLRQSSANLKSAQANLELAIANESREQQLFKQNYVSRQAVETATQARKIAAAQRDQARAAMEKDRVNLAYTVIRSPVSGVVIDRSVDVGQTVAASLQTPTLFKVAQDLSKMQIHANFAEADIGTIRLGQDVNFTVDAYVERKFNGKVKQIRLSPTVQQNVVTYDVVIDVNNPEKLLLPGMTAYVSIIVAERKEVLLVPNAALRFKPVKPLEDKGNIYVLVNNEPVARNVTIGLSDNRNSEIISGELQHNELVIIGANHPPSQKRSSKRRIF